MEPSVRLLCVDDSASGLIPVQQALEYASFPVEIVPAFTPEELAQRLSDAAYEAVIADVNAPWVDVDTMLDQIGKRLPAAPVIIVADPGLEGPITEVLKKGTSDYIPKHPPDIHRLPKNLETLLELQRLRREKRELSTIRAVRDLIDRSAQASIDELLREIAKTLPAGFRWPEKMAVQIRFGERTAESAGFVDKKPAFCKEFVTADGEEHGHVKAVWLEPPPMGGPPFLPEEEQLLDHVSRTLGAHLSRRVAEARYAAERQLTEHMMNNLPGWVFLVSRDGYYVRLNRRFAEATGYTNGELWGMDYTELVAPPDKEAVVRAFHTVFDEGYTEVEARITKKNGETIPYLFVVSRVTLEDEPYLLGVGVDISERRKAEEDNRLLRSAVENATEAIILTEGRTEAPGPRIVYANNAFLQMTGYTHDEVVGRVPWFLMGPKTDMHVIRELRDHLREGREFSGETTNYRKDRTEFVSEWSVAPVRDLSGAITHFVAILRDVTERRRLEVQLWSSMRLESIGRLAGGVAHDFNNLLAIIMGYSELVACSLPEDSPIAGDIEDIRQAAKRGGNLTRQLLAFSRRQVLTRRVIQLNEVVVHMERMLTRIIGADIELQLDLARGLWAAKLDIAQMEQVLLNLATNAREAMPSGGRLLMETANVEVDEAYARRRSSITPGPHIMLTITDTGRGMDKATAENIFEPFFTTKERDQSAGLGLATVYGIVKQSGGDIWVYSEPGKGTSFKMLFPAASQQEYIPAAESEPPSQAAGGSETVLVVEDEEAVRDIMERTLTQHGYTVLRASSGPEAVEVASHHEGPLHLLVTDVVMPAMSGHEVAESLAERRSGLNILCVSGYPKNIISEHGMLVPGAEYLEKPFTPTGLAKKVRQTLDKDA